MAQLQSRQYLKDEAWFPSRENDFVILDGDVFGKVLLQTPEVVELQVVGAVKTYPVQDYLAQRPRNLSLEGFAIPVTVGLDYRHQGEILSTIVEKLRAHLEARLEDQVFRGHLKDLVVDFNEAASSSLNIIVVGIFRGAAAEHYWSIRRFLQRAAVDACNRYGWGIPFDQLTVHLQPTGPSQSAATPA
jgi:small-conductance mechanosensitive channel